jgi:hypothetical protein
MSASRKSNIKFTVIFDRTVSLIILHTAAVYSLRDLLLTVMGSHQIIQPELSANELPSFFPPYSLMHFCMPQMISNSAITAISTCLLPACTAD